MPTKNNFCFHFAPIIFIKATICNEYYVTLDTREKKIGSRIRISAVYDNTNDNIKHLKFKIRTERIAFENSCQALLPPTPLHSRAASTARSYLDTRVGGASHNFSTVVIIKTFGLPTFYERPYES